MVNTEERKESEGKTVSEEGSALGVVTGGADAASLAGAAAASATGGKGKKRGKRSRQGHKAQEAQRGKTEVGVKTNRLT